MKKYNYFKIIQQMYVTRFEDVSCYECNASGVMSKAARESLRHDVAEYRLLGYPTRVIFRRDLNNV